MNTQDKINEQIKTQGLFCESADDIKNMLRVDIEKEAIESSLKKFAADVWDEAVKNQIENECMRQPKDRQSMYREFLLTVSDNPYRRETDKP